MPSPRVPRPSFLSDMAADFIAAFGDDMRARIEGGVSNPAFVPREVPVIIRELRENPLAQDIFTAVEGATHRCDVPISDLVGVSEGMILTLLPDGPAFTIRGLPDDGRAMAQVLLEEIET